MEYYWLIVLMVALLSTALTVVTLLEYGVDAGNHSLFVKIVRLKARRADATEFGNAIFDHVMRKVCNKGDGWSGTYDIRPAIELLDECVFEDAYTVVVRRLLEKGFKPVSLDKRSKVLMLG